jgi:hypothetical protein
MNANTKALKILVRAREDFQAQRKRMDNRIGRKASGEDQDVDERMFLASDLESFVDISDAAKEQEKQIQRKLSKLLKRFDIYNEHLKGVKGVGPISAAHIISQVDIHIAKTVSKIWQYCGLNPSKIRGKKRVQTKKPKTYKPKNKGWKVLSRRDEHVIILTDERIRGDKLTAGFISPYNKNLKTALMGVLASGFIKAQAPYALDFYYPYKERLEHRTDKVMHNGEKTPWEDVSKGHRDMAAKRYMIKMFLKDLYVVWRELEGLDTRKSYQEQYLKHKHTA